MPVEFFSWDEIKPLIKEVNAEFYEVLAGCPVLKKYSLKVYEYRFGETVADNDYFYAPQDSGIAPTEQVPFSMLLDKAMEKYVSFRGKCFTYEMM